MVQNNQNLSKNYQHIFYLVNLMKYAIFAAERPEISQKHYSILVTESFSMSATV